MKAIFNCVNLRFMFEITAKEIASKIGGTIVGDENVKINSVSKLEEGIHGSLGFFSNPKYEKLLYETQCSIVFVPLNFVPTNSVNAVLIKHENPYFAFCSILATYFNPNQTKLGISQSAKIDKSTKIGENAYIGENVTIEEGVIIGNNAKIYHGVVIGKNTILGDNIVLYPNVVLYSFTQAGHNLIVHSGTVIGSDGFGFAPIGKTYLKIPQVGNVQIGNDVEIGANCTIDRATMGSTRIGNGTKLDNLVQIAHNVEIGNNVVVASQTGIAGSTKIGDNCVFGGQVGVVGHINIAEGNSFGGQAGITGSVRKTNQKMTGTPAIDVNAYLRGIVGVKNIDKIMKELKELKQEIIRLKNQHE